MSEQSFTAKQAIYSGHVQGVGFRWTAQGVAKGFAVTGFVRNLRDGMVELLAQGEAGEVGRFLDAVADRLEANISEAAVMSVDGEPELGRFEIRR